jgi:CBS domain-containing protein
LTDGDLLNKANLLAPSAQQELTQVEVTGELLHLRQPGQTVGEVMTAKPITITPETTVSQAVNLMVEHDIKRLPVVDAKGKLLGLVSRVNVLRALAQPPVAETSRQIPPPGHHVRVNEIMMKQVPTVKASAPLAEIVDLLVSNVQRRVVVVDEQRQVIGIITDGDLIKRATPKERPGIIQSLARRLPPGQADKFYLSQRVAAEVMTSPVITVSPETLLLEALHLLLDRHIKRLPVVDAEGRLVGLVGRGGVLQVLSREL